MAQLKKLTFEEFKVKFEKLMRSIESFVPMRSEERVNEAGVTVEKESLKEQKKIDVKDVPVTGGGKLVMQKYGTNGPEDEYERVFWGDLKTMFDPPLSTNPVWNLPYQQKMLSWRYYDTCRVYCLTLESADIYMLTERRYPIPADVCQAMLDKKLQGDKKDEACYQLLKGKMNEVCYKLLKMIEKQAGIRK
ncbi:hypothetical protein Tco_0392538 [Tanacetum coccineum]